MTARRLVPAAMAAAAALAGATPIAAQMHGGSPEAAPGSRAVSITDRAMTPAVLMAAPGTRVTWINVGRDRHTVTADDGGFDSGVLAPGEEHSLTLPAAATRIPYHCTIHSFIRGTLVVSAVGLEAPAVVTAGSPAALTGVVPDATPGTTVVVEARLRGAWEEVARALTTTGGAYATATPPLGARTVLRARAGEEISPAVRVAVRPRIVVRRAGAALVVAVRAAAPRAGYVLEHLDLDTYMWMPARRGRLGAGGRARVGVPAPGVWRITVPRPGPGLAGASSAGIPVRAGTTSPHAHRM